MRFRQTSHVQFARMIQIYESKQDTEKSLTPVDAVRLSTEWKSASVINLCAIQNDQIQTLTVGFFANVMRLFGFTS
jgi:hypothetical protein